MDEEEVVEGTKRLSLPRRVLVVLGESPLPISTPDLIAIVGGDLPQSRQRTLRAAVHVCLKRLIKIGLAERAGYAKGPTGQVAMWKGK